MKKLFILPLALLVFATGCKDDDHHHDDDHKHDHGKFDHHPEIKINKPSADKEHYHPGDTVFVDVVVTDKKELHEAKCWFIEKGKSEKLWDLKRHSHSKEIKFNSYWVIPSDMEDDTKIEFVVEAENAGDKKATAKVEFEIDDH